MRPSAERAASATRVLHVINTVEVGGGGEHLIALTRGLAQRGFTSAVLAGKDGPIAGRLREIGVPVEVMGPMGPLAPLAIAPRLRASDAGLLHLHGSRAAFNGVLAARITGKRPAVYTAHALSFNRRLMAPMRWAAVRAESLICRDVDRVICLTRGDLEAAAARGVDMSRATVIPNGIDVSRFPARSHLRNELGLEAEAPVVGMLARLVPQKDPLAFVRMAAIVANGTPAARFLLVGEGPLAEAVDREAAECVPAGAFQRVGFRSDVPELLATLDVAVFPSLWEGLPLTVLEAMAARRALVASRLPGHAEVIEHGRTGLLVAAGDVSGFAREVLGLIGDPVRRTALGVAARAEVESRYSVERMVETTADLYRSLA